MALVTGVVPRGCEKIIPETETFYYHAVMKAGSASMLVVTDMALYRIDTLKQKLEWRKDLIQIERIYVDRDRTTLLVSLFDADELYKPGVKVDKKKLKEKEKNKKPEEYGSGRHISTYCKTKALLRCADADFAQEALLVISHIVQGFYQHVFEDMNWQYGVGIVDELEIFRTWCFANKVTGKNELSPRYLVITSEQFYIGDGKEVNGKMQPKGLKWSIPIRAVQRITTYDVHKTAFTLKLVQNLRGRTSNPKKGKKLPEYITFLVASRALREHMVHGIKKVFILQMGSRLKETRSRTIGQRQKTPQFNNIGYI